MEWKNLTNSVIAGGIHNKCCTHEAQKSAMNSWQTEDKHYYKTRLWCLYHSITCTECSREEKHKKILHLKILNHLL